MNKLDEDVQKIEDKSDEDDQKIEDTLDEDDQKIEDTLDEDVQKIEMDNWDRIWGVRARIRAKDKLGGNVVTGGYLTVGGTQQRSIARRRRRRRRRRRSQTYVLDTTESDPHPYNAKNKEISLSEIQQLLENYGLPGTVFDDKLFKRAFVNKSYAKTKSNERLEFLGDGVLECITDLYLYRTYPKENEGFMTEKKVAIVNNQNLGRIAYEMGLHKWLILSKSAEDLNMRTNRKKLADLFEAFLGALFLEFNKISVKDEECWFDNVFVTGPGFQMAQIFVEKVFEKHVDWKICEKNRRRLSISSGIEDDNYKSHLQMRIQKEFNVSPRYIELPHDLEDGYYMGVYLCIGRQQTHEISPSEAMSFEKFDSFSAIRQEFEKKGKVMVLLSDGYHRVQRKAEQIACKKAIIKIKIKFDYLYKIQCQQNSQKAQKKLNVQDMAVKLKLSS